MYWRIYSLVLIYLCLKLAPQLSKSFDLGEHSFVEFHLVVAEKQHGHENMCTLQTFKEFIKSEYSDKIGISTQLGRKASSVSFEFKLAVTENRPAYVFVMNNLGHSS